MVVLNVVGDWGDASLVDVTAVVGSVAGTFDAFHPGEAVHVEIEPTPSIDDGPITLYERGGRGEWFVRLNVRGRLWARLAFQFAHEYCHVLAAPTPTADDRFAWLEEALCETASLFALKAMSLTWQDAPPYPHWTTYSSALAEYVEGRLAAARTALPEGRDFLEWLASVRPQLEADRYRREDNAVVARRLLPVFERGSRTWYALRFVHGFDRTAIATLGGFVDKWADAAPAVCRSTIEAIGTVVAPEPARG